MFTAQIEWDCPEEFPDLSGEKYIAIDLERIIYESAQRDADPEHRTFFVGITRAKEKIFITNQDYEYQYNIGVPLI